MASVIVTPVPDGPSGICYQNAFDYDASGNLIYIGWAQPGASEADPAWSIKRLTYNGSNQLTLTQWAEGNSSFVNIWNNRASLTYL